jgi:hypothetical protein
MNGLRSQRRRRHVFFSFLWTHRKERGLAPEMGFFDSIVRIYSRGLTIVYDSFNEYMQRYVVFAVIALGFYLSNVEGMLCSTHSNLF